MVVVRTKWAYMARPESLMARATIGRARYGQARNPKSIIAMAVGGEVTAELRCGRQVANRHTGYIHPDGLTLYSAASNIGVSVSGSAASTHESVLKSVYMFEQLMRKLTRLDERRTRSRNRRTRRSTKMHGKGFPGAPAISQQNATYFPCDDSVVVTHCRQTYASKIM
jgi:hypothetical protein